MRPILSTALVLLLALTFASESQASFLPADFEVDVKSLPTGTPNMNETEFKAIINRVQQIYQPVVSGFGGQLSISGDWRSEKLNAGANQMFGRWTVVITGGLARRPELTKDGFTLILCHEVGHHLAGFPFAPSPSPLMGTWAANEGQADYFATQVCARKLWGGELAENAAHRNTVKPVAQQECDRVWSSTAEQNLCYRVLAGVESMIATMATLMNKPMPAYNTPDPAQVDRTHDGHPQPQCRMDTSLQGAICLAEFSGNVIPGKNVSGGTSSLEAEREAANDSCTVMKNFSLGLRPGCWFKARL